MIEYLGFLYGVAKDIKNYLKWDEEKKMVDRQWLEKSGFGKEMESRGYKLYWSRPEKVETKRLDGYEVIFEIDKSKRIRRCIEWSSGNDSLILLGKKKTHNKANSLGQAKASLRSLLPAGDLQRYAELVL